MWGVNAEKIIKMYPNYLIEERLNNHPMLNKLNNTSLNTIRIITFTINEICNILWAGIRIGAKGAVVDNISEGGSCAAIDLKTGKIKSEALDEHHNIIQIFEEGSIIGFQIPQWSEVLQFVDSVAKEIPSMAFVAWDIAISEQGIVLIEGNHGVSNTISQLHLGINQKGLRTLLNDFINKGDNKND